MGGLRKGDIEIGSESAFFSFRDNLSGCIHWGRVTWEKWGLRSWVSRPLGYFLFVGKKDGWMDGWDWNENGNEGENTFLCVVDFIISSGGRAFNVSIYTIFASASRFDDYHG